jgi:hypothetical protein
MHCDRFLQQLPELYDGWGQAAIQPKTDRFRRLLAQVQGMTSANVLQLLNGAVACLEPGEVYYEVGACHGATVIGALLGHPQARAVAVEHCAEFAPSGQNAVRLRHNLARFGVEAKVACHACALEEFFRTQRRSPPTIGVYFYAGAHDYRSQLLGLLMAKPFLAAQALVVVDDANCLAARQANRDFIATHPECQPLLALPTPGNGHPSFWNGLEVLVWDAAKAAGPDWSPVPVYHAWGEG